VAVVEVRAVGEFGRQLGTMHQVESSMGVCRRSIANVPVHKMLYRQVLCISVLKYAWLS